MQISRSNPSSIRWPREVARAIRICALGGVLTLAALAASAQQVAPRLTGAMVIADLAKVQQAVKARGDGTQDADLQAVDGQLQRMGANLRKMLGDDSNKPVATIDKDVRDAAIRAEAAAKRVQAWLDASATACTRDETGAMLAALTATLEQLSADTSSQKAPLPVIDGVETLDQRPLFVLGKQDAVPKFVLTGANLVDAQCANPEVTVVGADGKLVGTQPQLVAAQPGRVELQWPGAANLAPGAYTLRLAAERKGFLFGCTSQPPAVAVLQVAPQQHFKVSYALIATCEGQSAPVSLASATVSITGRDQTVTRSVDVSACGTPASYTLTAAAGEAPGQETKMGPVTQGPDAGITSGLGNGLTISWDPSLHQLLVRSGTRTCKGVY
ncbi:MAG: hypothetical protein J0H27_08955 [Xanthomonadales bacterium]|nr:hypothetical protein [Xanthomonadales bacterium]ODU93173.1 MAG: hypothetical protein ABT18_08800 [Rhodanobacter sp. SCN 66-43]OJY82076.1 MAG: hypothetical protein BGP23_00605 [Xanthomonadales bacterium 66-474]